MDLSRINSYKKCFVTSSGINSKLFISNLAISDFHPQQIVDSNEVLVVK